MNFRPVFIAGCDRSGTTLLGDLLGTSRWSIVTPESQFMHDLVIRLGLKSFDNAFQAAIWLQEHFRFAAWGMPMSPQELAELIDLHDPRSTIENLVSRYARINHPDKQSADIWIDHTPDNFKYQTMLKRLFPEARFIHIVRDGRAVCASIKSLEWGPNNAYMASRHWATRLQEALAVEIAEDGNCLRVRFEDLLEMPEKEIMRICQFIDLPYETALLEGGGLHLPAFTKNQHRLVGRSIDPSRAASWQRKLSTSEIRDFESYPLTHTLLNRLGYKTLSQSPPSLSRCHVLKCYVHDFFHYMLNRSKHKRMEMKAILANKHRMPALMARVADNPFNQAK